MNPPSRSGPGLLGVIDRAIYLLTQLADQLATLVCAFLIVATTIAVLSYQQGIAIVWLDDVLRMLLIWLVYLGAVSLCFHNDHISMDAIYLRMPPRLRRGIDIVVALLGVLLCGFIAKIGYDSLLRQIGYGTLSPSGYLPNWPQSLAIPVCFALMTVAYVSYLYAVLARRRRPSDEIAKPPEDF